MIQNYYNTIQKPSVAEFKDKGSRLVAFTFPLADVNEFNEEPAIVKKENARAIHHCFAYLPAWMKQHTV